LRLTLELVLHYRITSFKHYRIAIRRAPIGSGYSLHSARPMSVQASHSVVFLNVSPRYTSLHTPYIAPHTASIPHAANPQNTQIKIQHFIQSYC